METRSMKRKIGEISLQKKKIKLKRNLSTTVDLNSNDAIKEPLKVQEDSSSSSSKMDFPTRYDYQYLSLCESICRGGTDLGTGLGTSWDGPFWDKFVEVLNNHCGGNIITAHMCQQHLKRYRNIKQTILKPERASRTNLGYVCSLDEDFKTRLVRMLSMSSPSIRLGGSSSKSKSQSSGSKGKSVDLDAKSNMADLLGTFFCANHITLAELMTLEQTLLERAISCKAVLKLKNYNEQLQRVKEFLETQRGGGSGSGGVVKKEKLLGDSGGWNKK